MFALAWPAAMWAVFVVDALLPNSIARLDNLGIWPRSIAGLPGIAAAPFLHADIWHLLANTISFCVLGAVLVTSGRRLFTEVIVTTAIISGSGAWLFGQGGRPHEGASGVIYGMLGFLLARGWFSRKPVWAIISLVVGFFQLGSVFGLLRIDPNISWSSHFWGFIGGITLAWWRYGRDPARALPPSSRS
jgi:membrane associated rhomboid family serine protease